MEYKLDQLTLCFGLVQLLLQKDYKEKIAGKIACNVLHDTVCSTTLKT